MTARIIKRRRRRFHSDLAIFLVFAIYLRDAEATDVGPVTISGDTTWDLGSSPYVVKGNITVNNNATLTIDPGVEVKFDGNYRIAFSGGGMLDADGSLGNEITFTSNQGIPSAGYWNNLYFDATAGAGSIIDYAIIEYGGNSNNPLIDGNVDFGDVTNSTFRYSLGHGIDLLQTVIPATIDGNDFQYIGDAVTDYPIATWPEAGGSIENNSGSNNQTDVIFLQGHANMGVTQTYHAQDLPFYTNSDGIHIYNGAVLTLEAGLTWKFSNGTGNMIQLTNGDIVVAGTLGNPVTLTSAAASPAAGDWRGVIFHNTSGTASDIDYLNISYTGASETPAILGEGGSDLAGGISNSNISYTGGPGIDTRSVTASYPLITGNTLSYIGDDSNDYPMNVWMRALNNITSNSSGGNNFRDVIAFTETSTDADIAIGEQGGLSYFAANCGVGCGFYIEDNFTIGPNVTLQIDSGAGAGSIVVRNGGNLIINGSAGNEATITSSATSPAAGDWGGIEIGATAGAGTDIDYAIVSYTGSGGWDAFQINRSVPNGIANTTINDTTAHGIDFAWGPGTFLDAPMTDLTFSDIGDAATDFPILLDPDEAPLVEGITMGGSNQNDAIAIRSDTFSQNSIYDEESVPYYLTSGNIQGFRIGAGITLTIDEGAEINGVSGAGLNGIRISGGTVDINGTEGNPVVLSSPSDTPAAGDWGGVFIDAGGSQLAIDNAIIEYTGYGSIPAVSLGTLTSDSNITGTTIRYTDDDAISMNYADASTLTVANNTIHDVAAKGLQDQNGPLDMYGNEFYNIADNAIEFTAGGDTANIGSASAATDDSLVNVIHDSDSHGIYLNNAVNATVQHNLIYDMDAGAVSDYGIYADNAATLNVTHNTINNCGVGSGIYDISGVMVLKNSIVTDCANGISGAGISNTYNDIYNNTSNYAGGAAEGADEVHIDPLYIDTVPPPDYHLQPGSPVRAAGEGGTFMGAYAHTAGPAASVVLAAVPDTLTANGSDTSTLTATVTDAFSNPVADGTTVDFSVFSGGGAVVPLSDTTTGGEATSTYTAGTTAETVTVKAQSGAVSDTDNITLNPGPAANVALATVPDSITANGSDTSTLTATVTDAFGNDVADGATVDFSVTVGGGSVLPLSDTTVSGDATSTYTAGTTAETVTVKAQTGAISDTANITLDPGPAATLVLAAVPDSITANGSDTSTLTATVTDAFTNPVADGTTVDFSVFSGGGAVLPLSNTTTGGATTSTYTAGTTAETVTVKAESGAASDTDSITLNPGPAANVNLTTVPDSITANGADTSTLTATVTDAFDNDVADGTNVDFSVTVGGGSVDPLADTTTGGDATSTYTAGTTAETVTVKAQTGAISDTANITLNPGAAANLVLAAVPNTLTANGTDTSTLTATVTDAFSNPVADGTTVDFSVFSGSGSVDPASNTTTGGTTTSTYTASTTAELVTVKAQSGAVSDTATITLNPGPISTINLVATPDTLTANGTDTSTLTATVTDGWGNPVADGTAVDFSIESGGGSVDPASDTTTGGEATSTYTAGTTAETVTVKAQSGAISNTDDITLNPGIAANVSLVADPNAITADGNDTSTLTATVTDAFGNNVADGTSVDFSVQSGTGSVSPSSNTTTSGTATSTYTSSTLAGLTVVKAETGAVSDTANITLNPGPAADIGLTSDPSFLTANGKDTSTLNAVVTDVYGNKVADGTTISFSVSSGGGAVSPATNTTSDGEVTSTYTAGTNAETVVVKAQTGATSDTANITLNPGPAASISLTPDPDTLTANGSDTSTLTATVTDANDNLVADGTSVAFSILTGTGKMNPATDATENGQATSVYTAGTITQTVNIKAQTGAVSNTTNVTLKPGPPTSISLVADPDTLEANGTDTSALTADVTDAQGNKVTDGTRIIFSVDDGEGTVSPGPTEVISGQAHATYTASLIGGVEKVTARSENASGQTSITLIADEDNPLVLTLTTDSNTLRANGSDTAEITAHLAFQAGENVPDGTVITFAIESGGGTITPVEVPTIDGRATITYTAGTTVGEAIISASAQNTAGLISLRLREGGISFWEIIIEGFQDLKDFLEELREDPSVAGASSTAAYIAITMSVISFIAMITNTVVSIGLLGSSLLSLNQLFTEPLRLLQRKRKAWGVVYNSISKQPIDLAVVRLYDADTNRLINTRVTDRRGRFAFISDKGQYYMKVTKPDFTFPSQKLVGMNNDQAYFGLYFGGTIAIKSIKKDVNVNIPVDSHVQVKSTRKILNEYILRRVHFIIALSGSVVALITLVLSPSWLFIALLGVHVVLFFVFSRVAMGRKPLFWGRVTDSKPKPLDLAVVRVYDKQYGKLLETAVTDNHGRYGFLANDNIYYLTAEKKDYQPFKSDSIDLSRKRGGGVIKQNIKLKREEPPQK